MARKVFVGGLSWDTSDETLRAAFEKYGEVTEVTIITDRDTGRSRGFGFVEFADGESADKAISELNETVLDGRTIKVSQAKERKPRSGGGGGGGPRGGHSRNRW